MEQPPAPASSLEAPRRALRLHFDLPWSADRTLRALFGGAFALLLVDMAAFGAGLSPEERALVDMNWEANIPTWYASTVTLLTGLIAVGLSALDARLGRRLASYAWAAIAAFFVLLSVDDASEMHEQLATLTADWMAGWQSDSVTKTVFDSFESYYWQLYFLPFFAAAGLSMAWFLRRELGGVRGAWLFLSGMGLLVLAVFLDHLDPYAEIYERAGAKLGMLPEAAKHYARDVEEFVEMCGMSCILVSFADHFARRRRGADDGSAPTPEGTPMSKQIVVLVAVVGLLGIVAGGSLVFLMTSGSGPEAAPITAPPEPTAKAPAAAKTVEAPPLRDVAPADVSIDGFVLGMSEAQAKDLAQKLRLEFKTKTENSLAYWNFVDDKHDNYWSVRLGLSAGEVVGVRVKYKNKQVDRVVAWSEVLQKAYRDEGGERHWETTTFKAKATKDGEKFYVVRTQFRDAFDW